MNTLQQFHLIVTTIDGQTIDMTTGKRCDNLQKSASNLAVGELGVSFNGSVVSTPAPMCFIPAEDEEES